MRSHLHRVATRMEGELGQERASFIEGSPPQRARLPLPEGPVVVGIDGGYGERVSTAFVESTVNTVVGKRFSKRQQMSWSKPGAHLMLQTRTRVLDDTLRAKFQSWYLGLFNVQNADHTEHDLAA